MYSQTCVHRQPLGPKKVAVVDICSLIEGWDLKMVVVVDKLSLFGGGGRKLRFDCMSKTCQERLFEMK